MGLKSKKTKTILAVVALVVVGAVFLLVGGYLAEWNIICWFTQPSTIFGYFLVAFAALFLGYSFIHDWIEKR